MFLCHHCSQRFVARGGRNVLTQRRPRRGCERCQSLHLCFDWVPQVMVTPRKPGRPRKVGPAARADSSLLPIGR